MECKTKDALEQLLSDIRRLAAIRGLTPDQTEAAFRSERFAIELLKEHDSKGHDGKPCPYATRLSNRVEP